MTPPTETPEALGRRLLESLCHPNYPQDEILDMIAAGADVRMKDHADNTALHWAARDGHTAIVLALIANGADVNAKNIADHTPLHLTAYDGRTATAIALIKEGANIDEKDKEGKTFIDLMSRIDGIMAWAKENDRAKLADQIAAAMKSDTKDPEALGRRLLILFASSSYTPDEALALIAAGADVHVKNDYGYTALHIAALGGNTVIARALIEKGADINMMNDSGDTAESLALRKGYRDFANLISSARLEQAFLKNDSTKTSEDFADLADKVATAFGRDTKDPAETPEALGRRLLEVTRWKHPEDEALELIAKGADINAKDNEDFTILHWAACHGRIATALAVLEKGGRVNAKHYSSSYTPLHWAALHGHTDIARALIKNGADINAKSIIGEEALHLAAERGHTATVLALIEEGADTGAENKYYETPLRLAIRNRHYTIALALIVPSFMAFARQSVTGVLQAAYTILTDGDIDDTKAPPPASSTKTPQPAEQSAAQPPTTPGITALPLLATLSVLLADKVGSKLPFVSKHLKTPAAEKKTARKLGRILLHEVSKPDCDRGIAEKLIFRGADLSVTDKHGNDVLMLAAYNGYAALVDDLAYRVDDPERKNNHGVSARDWAEQRRHGKTGMLARINDAIAMKNEKSAAAREVEDLMSGETMLSGVRISEAFNMRLEDLPDLSSDTEEPEQRAQAVARVQDALKR